MEYLMMNLTKTLIAGAVAGRAVPARGTIGSIPV